MKNQNETFEIYQILIFLVTRIWRRLSKSFDIQYLYIEVITNLNYTFFGGIIMLLCFINNQLMVWSWTLLLSPQFRMKHVYFQIYLRRWHAPLDQNRSIFQLNESGQIFWLASMHSYDALTGSIVVNLITMRAIVG